MPGTSISRTFAASFVALTCASARAQQEAWRVSGVLASENFGASLAIVDDHDGDGVRDLVVGSPGHDGATAVGRVLLLSGVDLSVLLDIAGPAGEQFGAAVADAGDVDGDGVGDLFVGSPVPGIARLCSGATGATLLQLGPANSTDYYGAVGAGLGDVDGDGVPDFAVGAPLEVAPGAPGVGVVRIVSAATGTTLATFAGSHTVASVGNARRLANAGDQDGDGVSDLALLDVEQPASSTFRYGVVRVKSGATGVELLTVKFDQVGYRAFHLDSIASAGDVDGDGVDDLVVGALPNDPTVNPGRVFVLSGATGATLLRFDAGDEPEWVVVGPAGDVDGDLVPDLAVATTTAGGWTPDPFVMVASGATGATLGTIGGTANSSFGVAFAAGIDSDGDGQPDVAIGDPSAKRRNLPTGELRLASWPTGSLIVRTTGNADDQRFEGDIALIDDFDGDGTNDFVVAAPRTAAFSDDALRVHSGRDGSLLVEHLLLVVPDGELIAVPDQDGDGHDDVAFGEDVGSSFPAVEVRSTATGALLRRITATQAHRFGSALAVGVQPGGAVHLAVGAYASALGGSNSGEVDVYDLATGALVFQRAGSASERLGQAVAWLGDVDGDGVGDWAFGGPNHAGGGIQAGRVTVVSGNNAPLRSIQGKASFEGFGSAVAGVGDLDGDGRPDLAAAAPGSGAMGGGEVRLYVANGWSELAHVRGILGGDRFGSRLEVLPDLNGDGVGEWLALGSNPARVDVRSGGTMGLLARLGATSLSARFATPQPWQLGSANGDAIPDVLICDAEADDERSQAWLIALDDLLLQIDPAVASAGDTVTHAVRGGPVGRPVALEFVAFSGVPVHSLIEKAFFDGAGTWSTSDVVPPGLAGLDADFRGWAVGFNGRLMNSPVQRLTFQ